MSQKRLNPEVTPSEFFEGVAEMRAQLDRNSSQSGRELLMRMAFDLTKPRSFEALCEWFCEAMMRALAARGTAIIFAGGRDYATQVTSGRVRNVPQIVGVSHGGGTFLPLVGSRGTFGALWVEHDQPIDPSLAPLVTAVIDAVAMSLDSLRERSATP